MAGFGYVCTVFCGLWQVHFTSSHIKQSNVDCNREWKLSKHYPRVALAKEYLIGYLAQTNSSCHYCATTKGHVPSMIRSILCQSNTRSNIRTLARPCKSWSRVIWFSRFDWFMYWNGICFQAFSGDTNLAVIQPPLHSRPRESFIWGVLKCVRVGQDDKTEGQVWVCIYPCINAMCFCVFVIDNTEMVHTKEEWLVCIGDQVSAEERIIGDICVYDFNWVRRTCVDLMLWI